MTGVAPGIATGIATGAPLIEARGLTKLFIPRKALFGKRKPAVRAVDGVDFAIARGETLGLVGESGCGKSTTGRLLLRLIEPTAGAILHRGDDITALSGAAMRARRQSMQIVFQDPYSSLNPRMRVGDILREPLIIHDVGDSAAQAARVLRLLDLVGLARSSTTRYPHEFSGGQRQRIGIARALALEPEFVVADEAVSALDVSVQAQVINLMRDLQRELGLAYLFISHNLAVVRHFSDRVAVMYLGRIIETARADVLFADPRHPYTRALLASSPAEHPDQRRAHAPLRGDLPSAGEAIVGCGFASRCPHVEPRCATIAPALLDARPGHAVACHRAIDNSLPTSLTSP